MNTKTLYNMLIMCFSFSMLLHIMAWVSVVHGTMLLFPCCRVQMLLFPCCRAHMLHYSLLQGANVALVPIAGCNVALAHIAGRKCCWLCRIAQRRCCVLLLVDTCCCIKLFFLLGYIVDMQSCRNHNPNCFFYKAA